MCSRLVDWKISDYAKLTANSVCLMLLFSAIQFYLCDTNCLQTPKIELLYIVTSLSNSID